MDRTVVSLTLAERCRCSYEAFLATTHLSVSFSLAGTPGYSTGLCYCGKQYGPNGHGRLPDCSRGNRPLYVLTYLACLRRAFYGRLAGRFPLHRAPDRTFCHVSPAGPVPYLGLRSPRTSSSRTVAYVSQRGCTHAPCCRHR